MSASVDASAPVRLVVADDHPMFRFGLRAELVRLVEELSPEVALTDLEMPGVDGLSALAMLTARFPYLGVLVLTMHADDERLLAAVRAGARGYLLKGAEREEITRAVLVVAAGGTVFGGEVGRRIAAYATRPLTAAGKVFPELTDR